MTSGASKPTSASESGTGGGKTSETGAGGATKTDTEAGSETGGATETDGAATTTTEPGAVSCSNRYSNAERFKTNNITGYAPAYCCFRRYHRRRRSRRPDAVNGLIGLQQTYDVHATHSLTHTPLPFDLEPSLPHLLLWRSTRGRCCWVAEER